MEKRQLLNCSLCSSFIGFAMIFGGCSNSNSDSKSHKTALHVGHFVSVFKKKVKYKCDNKMILLSSNNEFKCNSFPIAFYSDNIKLGEINSIHEDGYVFPQDIIVVEEPKVMYSSNEQMLDIDNILPN